MTDSPFTTRSLLQTLFFVCFVKPFLTLFIGLRVRGLENLPTTDPFILIANHSSHLDTVSLLNLFPVRRLYRIRPAAAADYFEKTKVASFVSRTFFNILPIARKNFTADNHPLDTMERALRAGNSIILFPEGTRGSGGEMAPFRSGIARLVERVPEIPVTPAYLVNMGRSLPKGELIPVPFFCEVRIGAPRTLSGDKDAMLAELEAAVKALRDEE